MTDSNQNGFIGHLIELRNRLMKALISIFLIFIALVYFANDIYAFVAAPLVDSLPKHSTMIATDVTAPFLLHLNLLCLFLCFLQFRLFCIKFGALSPRDCISTKEAC